MGKPSAPRSARIAVDANFLIDLHKEKEFALAALELIRERVVRPKILIPPTAGHELALMAKDRERERRETAVATAEEAVAVHKFTPAPLIAVNHGIADRIAQELMTKDIIPTEERNDALILAESCLLDCTMLITSDSHLLDADKQAVREVLDPYGAVPAIVSPSGLLGMFDS